MAIHQLGPYHILEPLGRGGMGTVYAAVDTVHQRSVAVKVLAPGVAHDPGFRERFESEVRSLEQLRHPCIVQLFGYGEQDGHVYYAMEIMSGRSLQDELAAGRRFGWREAVPIIVDLCGALKHAHDHGIIHRDIKPANLLVDTAKDGDREREIVKLSDFGIAKLFGNQSMTVDGGVLGTADYMSPEQAEGDPVSPRSDLYSLGCVLYALLAGRPPFRGKSIPEVIHKVRFDQPPPISRFVDDVPKELERIVHQLLEKSPEDRVPTALALSKRLQALQHGLTMRLSRQEEAAPADTQQSPPQSTQPQRDHAVHLRDTMSAAAESADRMDSVENVGDVADVNATTSTTTREDRYVRVERTPRSLDRPQRDDQPVLRWLTISGLVLLLLLLVGTAWMFIPRQTADKLFAEIEKANASADMKLGKVESKVNLFLQDYADDPRAVQVSEWREQIEASRIETRLERTMRHGWNPGKGSPLEELIMRGMQIELNDPARARRMYQNVIAMYPKTTEMGIDDRLLLRVVDDRLKHMKVQFNRSVDTHLALIQNRLDKADSIRQQDPDAARRLLEAIVDTYSEFSWADGAIDEVRSALKQMDTRVGLQ